MDKQQQQQQQQVQPPVANKQQKQKKQKKEKPGKAQVDLVNPEFIDERIKIWNDLKQKNDEIANLKDSPIKISLPDGRIVDGLAGKTSPLMVAKGIRRTLADSIVSSVVDGQIWDISRPLESDCNLVLCEFDSEAGKKTFWHSSAHILGQAMELIYGGQLCIGPATSEGFYYDMAMPENKIVSSEDYDLIVQVANKIIQEKQAFERLSVPRDLALQMFKYNKYKSEIISKIPADETVSLYRCGSLIDLCRGPHLPNTGYVKAFSVVKNSSAYWLGKAENDPLQRVYGISFPDKKQMQEYEEFMKDAALRDHRNIGKNQELFFFHPFSPGCAMFLPHGARIYNRLMEFIRHEYHRRGFTEVITPVMFSQNLWEQSGHWGKYSENMFNLKCDDMHYSLKPMNCPSHCLMFGNRSRSYRELPIRFADFGALHRNELAGALTGLTRVRKFQQDDGHIFCAPNQVEQEISSCLEFMRYVYGIFGLDFQLVLSTRPDNYLGTPEQWDVAENALKDALNRFGKEWKLNPEDGAFYGPKIDVKIIDAMKRAVQCATIQLDFQLPIRFGLEFMGTGPEERLRPVIIHRAVLGSVERMMAILIEHTAGKWPFWVSPRQVLVATVSDKFSEYAKQVVNQIIDAGYYADVDLSDKTLPKKVREAQLAQYNYILVVGEEEMNNKNVNVRTRDNVVRGSIELSALLEEFKENNKNFK